MGDETVIKEAEAIGFDFEKIDLDSIQAIKQEIELSKTNLDIYLMVNSGEKKNEFDFLQELQRLSNFWGRNIPRSITIAEWVFLIRDTKAKNKKHGEASRIQ